MAMKLSVRPDALHALLDQMSSGIETLSLDCFDTLLWRNVQAPRDVFAGIALPGGAVEARMWAESAARRAKLLRKRTSEVSLTDIYTRLHPRADAAEITAAIDHEIALEASHCFAFAPTVALMQAAKARGLRVIVISDFYLSEAQLRDLIARAAGDDVLALIDRIFVSADHGTGKGGELFPHVLKTLDARPETLFHVGDNRRSDHDAPARHGIASAHLVQFDAGTVQRLRLEAVAGALVDPAARVTAPLYQPHRAAVALRSDDTPAAILGHDVLGPVMLGFARWLHDEIAARSARLGKPVRPLFLMRDGHLPLEVFRAACGEAHGPAPIEISRFAAACASLTDIATLGEFVTEALDRAGPDVVAHQLMLHGHEAAKLAKLSPSAFRREVMKPALANRILARSRAYTDRLVAHLAQAGIRSGDAVMLVDLGYNGSVQNLTEPVLRKRLNLDVCGRYLLLREEQRSGLDKAGFLDTRHYETRMLHALCTTIAVLEQLCTVAQGSTVDYTPAGDPIRKDAGIKGGQSAIRDAVQAACIAFARDAGRGVHRQPSSNGAEADRRAAAAVLARLLFIPSAEEVALLEAFDHDVNLGTKDVVKLLDADESAEGLRRRGLAYLNETGRMFIPGELQRHGLPLNLSLFSATRFALDLRNSDFEVGGFKLPVIVIGEAEQAIVEADARPTAEGYYRAIVPVGTGRFTPAIQLGARFEWVQIAEARWTPLHEFDANGPPGGSAAAVIADGMEAMADGLYRCTPAGFLFAPPPKSEVPLVLSVIFRPIRWRDAAGEARIAA